MCGHRLQFAIWRQSRSLASWRPTDSLTLSSWNTSLVSSSRTWIRSLTSTTTRCRRSVQSLQQLELGSPFDRRMMLWKFCDDISNSSRVFMLTDKQSSDYWKQYHDKGLKCYRYLCSQHPAISYKTCHLILTDNCYLLFFIYDYLLIFSASIVSTSRTSVVFDSLAKHLHQKKL